MTVAAIDPQNLRHSLEAEARRLGFDAFGIARAGDDGRAGIDLMEFLRAGRTGDMDWMQAKADRRVSPTALWPEARSIVSLGMNYGPGRDPSVILGERDRGAISVYAQGRDYHDVIKKRLKQLARWLVDRTGGEVKVFVDTAPVMEKPAAARAGLGWQGKHTNLVSRAFGSWLFLGEIFTTLELPPDDPGIDVCGTCDACLRACPTGALDEPYRIDARRCVSYLTIEHKSAIDDDLADAMGNRIYGCDDCLAACPWNKFDRPTAEPALMPKAELTAPRLADLAQLDDAAFRELFAGSPIKRTGRDRFVRNVLIAIGNSGDPALAPAAADLTNDPSPLVRAAAHSAVARLAKI